MDNKGSLTQDEGDAKATAPIIHTTLKSREDELSHWQTIVRYKKAVFICTLLCFAATCDGYQINLNGNIIANTGFIRQIGIENPPGTYVLKTSSTALWGAMQSLGQLIAMVGLTPISDRIGRKWTLYALWIILAGSLLIETFVQNDIQWAGAKLLAGVGVGAIQATLPVIIAETGPVNIRGLLITAYSFWYSVGALLAPSILYGMNSRPLEFLIPIYTQWAFLAIMLPIFLWIPETPSYFVSKGMDEHGIASLRRINGGIKGYNVESEYTILKNTFLEEQSRLLEMGAIPHGWRELVGSYMQCFNRHNIRRTMGAALPAVLQQLSGLAFLSIYSSLFFRESGFSNAFQITSITSGIRLATIVAVAMVTDLMGRRHIVLGSGAICVASMLIIGSLGLVADKTQEIKNALIFLACFWSVGSSTCWTFAAEVPTQKLRARAAGIASAMGVVFGLTFNTAVPTMLQTNGANLGYKTAWIFFGCGSVALILAVLFVPETARRNAAELDEMYEKSVPCWRMSNFKTDVQQNMERSSGVGPRVT